MSIPEPYRIKMVEPIHLISPEEREIVIRDANYNLFQIPAGTVYIDLLTDSGTGAMSSAQWAEIMLGDESYAGAKSYYLFRDSVQDLFGMPYVLPTHQGRGAERVLFMSEVKKGDIVPSNAHFDTTRANLEFVGALPLDLPATCANIPDSDCLFKGNMHTARLSKVLAEQTDRIPFVMLTITNNRAGGQPVSMENLQKVAAICRAYKKRLIIDACRHAENAYFIKKREPGYRNRTVAEIVRETFSLADAMFMSAKKDALCNIGGLIALSDEDCFQRLKSMLILTEGFSTYGGLAGRDLGAMAVGLWEAIQEDYLEHRIGQAEYLSGLLRKNGIPVYAPAGGHAVYVDARKFFEGREMQLPGQALVAALYMEGGIRTCDVGAGMFPGQRSAPKGEELELELVRLALPRRTYTESHLQYVADVLVHLYRKREQIPDLRCIDRPAYLGHFQARFEPVPAAVQMAPDRGNIYAVLSNKNP